MIRTTSNTGRQFIGKQEWVPFSARCGWNAAKGLYFVYLDYKGFPTFGPGILVQPGDDFSAGRTFDEVDVLYSQYLIRYEKPVQDLDDLLEANGQKRLEQWEFDALVSFVWNEGIHSLNPATNSFVRAMLNGLREQVPALMLPWDVTAGVHDPGLHHRRESEGYVFSHPYPTEQTELERYLIEVRAILAKAPMFDLTAGAFNSAHGGELHEDDDEPPTKNDLKPVTEQGKLEAMMSRDTLPEIEIEAAPPTDRNS